ncbi:MAG TPA: N-methyl-L-tryptophan oxidase [Verrucomicrobiae bacterium]|nr:N-methyl-L-tryptophan oxidase [Verrucomicrobiae bacterium]
MPPLFDVIIAGLGAMGSAAAFHLSRRGQRVLGLDRFSPPHTLGSSHGQTRIIREAYFEHPLYVPLVQRAYELWTELEAGDTGSLLRKTGGLMIGRPESAVPTGAQSSAKKHGLRHEVLTAVEVARHFPAFRLAPEMIAVWEPRAGILFPEKCVAAHLAGAKESGAVIQTEEPVMHWDATTRGVRVTTSKGEYHTGRLLLAAGSWLPSLTPELQLPVTIERQVQYWFGPRENASDFSPDRCPIHIWDYEDGHHFYGFPDLGEGIKVACHHEGSVGDPNHLDREVQPTEVAKMREILGRFLPNANGPLRATAVCMYTNMPDYHFLIDWHPAASNVLIASPCSGHGFKFSAAVGEVVADLLTTGRTRFDLSLFRMR